MIFSIMGGKVYDGSRDSRVHQFVYSRTYKAQRALNLHASHVNTVFNASSFLIINIKRITIDHFTSIFMAWQYCHGYFSQFQCN